MENNKIGPAIKGPLHGKMLEAGENQHQIHCIHIDNAIGESELCIYSWVNSKWVATYHYVPYSLVYNTLASKVKLKRK